LGGKLDSVPFHTGKGRGRRVIDLGKQGVQGVAAFVKERDDVVVGQQAGPVCRRTREIAGEVHNGGLYPGWCEPARSFAVDPGAALLALSGVQIEIKRAERL